MMKDFGKLLMVLEAFFGGFYVAVSRNLFVPMLAYSGYSLQLISYVTLAAALLSIIASYLIYNYPKIVESRTKLKLILFHAIERFIWFSLPFMLNNPNFMIVTYAIAQGFTIPVGVLITVAMFTQYQENDFVDLTIKRTAASSAASILGMMFSTYVSAEISPPQSYLAAYSTALLVGLVSTLTLVPYNISSEIKGAQDYTISEEIEFKRINTFVLFALMMVGGNILGLSWSPLLRNLNAPVYIAVGLSLAGSVGGTIGPYLWKGYRQYLLAIMFNIAVTTSVMFITIPEIHLILSFLASMTFLGVNLLATSIYSRYVKVFGVVKASMFLTSANSVGLLIASFITSFITSEPTIAIVFSTAFRLLALLVALFAIPETAITPPSTTYEFGRIVYSSSVLGYTFTVTASKSMIKFMIEILALTFIIALLYFIYRIAGIIVGV
ncbi:MAG: hypothetical protein QW738_05805 [Nitrososphaeria archaeon]